MTIVIEQSISTLFADLVVNGERNCHSTTVICVRYTLFSKSLIVKKEQRLSKLKEYKPEWTTLLFDTECRLQNLKIADMEAFNSRSRFCG